MKLEQDGTRFSDEKIIVHQFLLPRLEFDSAASTKSASCRIDRFLLLLDKVEIFRIFRLDHRMALDKIEVTADHSAVESYETAYIVDDCNRRLLALVSKPRNNP